jgi:hypothetical protein
MQRTAAQTAILLALLFKRANAKRARISERTIRVVSRRRSLRVAFLDRLRGELDDLGLHIIELERGGFGLIPIGALDGAASILAKNYIITELRRLRAEKNPSQQEKLFAEFRAEAEVVEDEEGETNEE